MANKVATKLITVVYIFTLVLSLANDAPYSYQAIDLILQTTSSLKLTKFAVRSIYLIKYLGSY